MEFVLWIKPVPTNWKIINDTFSINRRSRGPTSAFCAWSLRPSGVEEGVYEIQMPGPWKTRNHKIELGANWIHGVLGNPMYEIAMVNGLIDIVHVPSPHKVVAATEDGKQIPFQVLQEIYEAYVCFLRRCEEYFLCHYSPPTGINSVGEHISLEAALYLDRSSNDAERHLRQLIFDCLLKRETCITGCHSMDEIDLLELGSYTELQGGNIVLPSGYSSILEPVSREIPQGNVCKRRAVTTIRWRYADESISADITSPGGDSGIDLLASGDPGNESDDSDRTVTGEQPRRPSEASSRGGSSEKEFQSAVTEDQKNSCTNLEQCEKGCEETSQDNSENKATNTSESGETSSASFCQRHNHDGDSELSQSKSVELVPNAEIVCEDGSHYYADHVICTVPLGVLKEKAATLFSPPLLQYKLDSIDRLLFGTVDKIILEYDRPFLNPDVSEVMLLWETDVEAVADDLSNTWYRKIYSFSKLSETPLLGWISGREAKYMETLSHDQVADTCTDILRKFLSDPFIPKPKLCICTSWHKQPYTRGSYTAMAVGASHLDIEHIVQPLYANPQQEKPVVLFAGEHTHSSFYSTVHGAYLTGRSAAQVLLSHQSPQELVMEYQGTSDLSSWIQGISLD
ncbi:peroxisomal N(1)-acetyl-spermine/spermidine oxidase isoform X1 [Cryptotermes secundus]|uniref:peroxisomal N(1)-acetyl-spermine/spermidine oxidase isoform X1 n=2 Tax=Cryptotermes secundus TaxID=105785 RepID=UPI000CD7B583|nr:peroxisomal N(1)-acetyl-spermine/spermidine oxidase isoform X1 [Cryptotermes secundus]